MSMNILLLSHTATSSNFVVGSHHYLRELNELEDCSALHTASPDYPLSFLKRKEPRPRNIMDPKVHAIFPLGRSIILDAFSNKVLPFQIDRELSRRGIGSLDFIVVDQPSFADTAIKLAQGHSAILIYRPTDVYLEMSGGRIFRHEMKILAHAQGIVATSHVVLKKLIENYPRVPLKRVVIENGYDARHFHRVGAAAAFPPQRLVYIGSLDSRFDFDAVRELSLHRPTLSIDIYGPVTSEAASAQLGSNVSLKGPINYESVPAMLSRYDAALLPMKKNLANEGRSPMKLYEYLACGLPVLTRASDSLRDSGLSNLYFYDETKSIQDAFDRVRSFVYMGDDLSSQSWQKKTTTIINFLKQFDNPC